MIKYLVMLAMLVFGSAACSPTAANMAVSPTEESAAVLSEELPEHDEESEDLHDEEDETGHEHEEEEHREHGPHEHGSATLSVAWSGNEIEVDLDTPGFNLFGFEHEPTTDEESQIVAGAVQALESGDLLILNSEAACRVTDVAVTTDMSHEGDGDAEHDESDHEEEDEVHSDAEAQFSYVCDSPEAIRLLDLSALFDRFPNFETLNVQWISDTSQSAAELTAESPVLNFQP